MRRSATRGGVDDGACSEDVAAVRSWRRTGPIAGWGAVVLLVAAVGWRFSTASGRTGTALLAVAAVVCALVAHLYLNRVWADASMVAHPSAVPLRRLSVVAAGCYGAVLLSNAYVAAADGDTARPVWLVVAVRVLGGIAAACFVVLLVLAGRLENRP